MLPIVLVPGSLRVGVAGAGAGLERRLDALCAAGVTPRWVMTDAIPTQDRIAELHLLFVAGWADGPSQEAADAARLAGVLVNVEDRPGWCDFHMPACVRRGDLLFSVSSGGRSPAVTRLLREELERHFSTDWDARLEELAELRRLWRDEGVTPESISARTRHLVATKGWLS